MWDPFVVFFQGLWHLEDQAMGLKFCCPCILQYFWQRTNLMHHFNKFIYSIFQLCTCFGHYVPTSGETKLC
jgi:hypothetical protein